MRILLVEDDAFVAAALKKLLVAQQYQVDVAATGLAGWELVKANIYDLLLLDWMLPGLDGVSFCRQLRSLQDGSNQRTPILLMTAFDSQTHRIIGLDAGADDYVVKPFDTEELLARIRALLRRMGTVLSSVVEWGDLQLDPRDCQVTHRGQPLSMTAMEYRILELLLRNPRQIFSQQILIDRLWAFEKTPTEATVRAHIRGLRKKLRQVGAGDAVETVHGFGYRLGKAVKEQENEAAETVEETTAETLGLTALWEKNRQSYLKRMAVLEQAIAALQNHTCTEDLQQQAKRQIHTLVGSLGSFGLEAASILCRDIEQSLNADISQIPIEFLAAQIVRLNQLVEQGSERVETLTNRADPKRSPQPLPKLLIIDDDAALAQALLTESKGCNVRADAIVDLTTAQRTVRQICQGVIASPDILLLNLCFFGAASVGLEFLEALTSTHPALRVMIFTAQQDLVTRAKATQLGSWQFLQKPIAPEQLLKLAIQLWQQSIATKNRLMIVDDDPQLLASLQHLLQPEGFELTLLQDSLLFWDTLQQSRPDLLIIDVEMPNFSGIELCRVLRNDPHHSRLPVVFLSAHRDAETIHQAFVAGADDYLTKPIHPTELRTRLINRLGRLQS
jgi:DNA-binding response OmpR family regulator